MDKHEWARRMAITANVLIIINIFVAMTWWGASVVLFSACFVLYGAAWWMKGASGETAASAEESGLANRFMLPPMS